MIIIRFANAEMERRGLGYLGEVMSVASRLSFLAFLLCLVSCTPRGGQEVEKTKVTLDATEEALVRKLVDKKGLITSHQLSDEGIAYTELAVPKELVELHKKKRVPMLRLLLDIIKNAIAHDALSAAAFADALEDNPVSAAFYARCSTDDFDEGGPGKGSSRRHAILAWLEKHLAEIEKK